MIRPPGWDGVAFSSEPDGDMRHDPAARSVLSRRLGIDPRWATVRQVHGAEVVRVDGPGDAGEADAVWTSSPGVPVAVLTADCFGVVLQSDAAVGVAHCGWRGVDADVAEALRRSMTEAGHEPWRASIGPGIGSCCFEVGDEVADLFEGRTSLTTWGTMSVDLPGVLRDGLGVVEWWAVDECTRHEPGWFSHRRDRDTRRLAAIGWLR